MSDVLDLALKQGIWCALFVVLFYWTIKQNTKREISYQATISENQGIIKNLTENIIPTVCTIKEDVEVIKDEIKKKVG